VSSMRALCSSKTLKGVCGVSTSSDLFAGDSFTMSSSDISAFPTISFVLEGNTSPTVTVNTSPQKYLLTTDGSTYRLGISSGTIFVLGDSFMEQYNVVFDNQRSIIGFGDTSTCPTVSPITTGGGNALTPYINDLPSEFSFLSKYPLWAIIITGVAIFVILIALLCVCITCCTKEQRRRRRGGGW